MNNISIARESIRITQNRQYEKNGSVISLPNADYAAVHVYTPAQGAALADAFSPAENARLCRITVTAEDSFAAAARYSHALVLNFANAHHAGGGFLLGANAQEESLCRCSTLYASLTSDAAKEMYRYNNTHLSAVESDYMLLSDPVCVFRSANGELLDTPFQSAVITAPAPNRRGAAVMASAGTVRNTFLRRIRMILAIAAEQRYRSVILGAWGCGAFGNDPKTVAEVFWEVLVSERFGTAFDEVCFAVYGNPQGKNYRAFASVFADMHAESSQEICYPDLTTDFLKSCENYASKSDPDVPLYYRVLMKLLSENDWSRAKQLITQNQAAFSDENRWKILDTAVEMCINTVTDRQGRLYREESEMRKGQTYYPTEEAVSFLAYLLENGADPHLPPQFDQLAHLDDCETDSAQQTGFAYDCTAVRNLLKQYW